MGVSKNRGTPKWMVYNGKPLLKSMIWGYHDFWKHPYAAGTSKRVPFEEMGELVTSYIVIYCCYHQ